VGSRQNVGTTERDGQAPTRFPGTRDALTPDILRRYEPLCDETSMSEVWKYDANTVLKRTDQGFPGEVAAICLVPCSRQNIHSCAPRLKTVQ
jgi:hypothetical protein